MLFPEQRFTNNPNMCFNWFVPEHARRDIGEPLSIRQMVAAMVARHGIDPERIYVTGLSAGGAMASILLATYPDVFAGGAIIAGLPFGAARSIGQAFAHKHGHGYPADASLVASVREASSHRGPWPTIAVWQGRADTAVNPSNATRIVAQWRGVHGIATERSTSDRIDGCTRTRWFDLMGRVLIESWLVPNMGHGTPLKTSGPAPARKPGRSWWKPAYRRPATSRSHWACSAMAPPYPPPLRSRQRRPPRIIRGSTSL